MLKVDRKKNNNLPKKRHTNKWHTCMIPIATCMCVNAISRFSPRIDESRGEPIPLLEFSDPQNKKHSDEKDRERYRKVCKCEKKNGMKTE